MSAAAAEHCPHCWATDAVPLASGLGCTNAWHHEGNRRERLADIEAAANLLAGALSAADAATVDSICGDEMFCVVCKADTPVRPWVVEGASYVCSQCSCPIRCTGCNQVWYVGHDCLVDAAVDAEAEARWLTDYTRPPEPVDVVRDALLADVEPMSVTGRGAPTSVDRPERAAADVAAPPAAPSEVRP